MKKAIQIIGMMCMTVVLVMGVSSCKKNNPQTVSSFTVGLSAIEGDNPFDDENVGIRLNRAHPLFDLLKIDASLKDSPFFIEVLSSALLVMINSVRDGLGPDWEGVIESQDFVHGSIAEAIYYFIHKLQWDISSQANLSKSIHLYFEKTL